MGDYSKIETVLEKGEKINKTPTVDQIANLFGWLQEGFRNQFYNVYTFCVMTLISFSDIYAIFQLNEPIF